MPDEQTAFEELIKTHAAVIAAAVRRVCRQRYQALVPDITQEVHVAIWKVLESGKKIDHPASYLYKVALTTGLAMVQKTKKQWLIARNLEQQQPAPAARDDKAMDRARLIEELLAQLPQDRANALRAYLAGYNHVDIAKLFGWSESTARHNVYRSIDKLKKFMRARGGAEEGGDRGRT